MPDRVPPDDASAPANSFALAAIHVQHMLARHARAAAGLVAVVGVGLLGSGLHWLAAAVRAMAHPVPLVQRWGLFGVVFFGGLGVIIGSLCLGLGVLVATYGLPESSAARQTPPL